MNILGIIPARGGSKRLPGKNVRPIAGRPLLAYSILVGQASRHIDWITVSSDDATILRVAGEWGAEPIRRPSEISNDTAPTIQAMQHALDVVVESGRRVDHVALLQCTCPLRRAADVDRMIDEYLASGADSALTCNEIHLKAGKRDPQGWYRPQYKPGVRKQDLEPLYQENGAFYMVRADLVRQGTLLAERTLILECPPEAGIASIDTQFDFDLAEALYHQLGYETTFREIERRGRQAA